MSKNTQGEWRAYGGGHPRKSITIRRLGGPEIATIKGQAAYDGVKDYEERIANGFLIAAAPELLDTLKVLAGLYEKELVNPESSHWLGKARAVIAKAEGRE